MGDGGSSKTAPSATPRFGHDAARARTGPTSVKPPMVRKATMIGLGAMGSHAASAAAKAAESSPPPAAGNMFPSSDSERTCRRPKIAR